MLLMINFMAWLYRVELNRLLRWLLNIFTGFINWRRLFMDLSWCCNYSWRWWLYLLLLIWYNFWIKFWISFSGCFTYFWFLIRLFRMTIWILIRGWLLGRIRNSLFRLGQSFLLSFWLLVWIIKLRATFRVPIYFKGVVIFIIVIINLGIRFDLLLRILLS